MTRCVVCLEEPPDGVPPHNTVAACLAGLAQRVAVLDAKVQVTEAEFTDADRARPALALCKCGWFAVAPRESALSYGKAHAGEARHEVEYHALGVRWKVGRGCGSGAGP